MLGQGLISHVRGSVAPGQLVLQQCTRWYMTPEQRCAPGRCWRRVWCLEPCATPASPACPALRCPLTSALPASKPRTQPPPPPRTAPTGGETSSGLLSEPQAWKKRCPANLCECQAVVFACSGQHKANVLLGFRRRATSASITQGLMQK